MEMEMVKKERRRDDEGKTCWCYYHPEEVVVGVCALCLHERLANLLAHQKKQQLQHHRHHLQRAFGSLLSRLDIRHHRKSAEDSYDHHHEYNDEDDDDASTTTQQADEDFISIKFEDNGRASWEKQGVVKKSSSSRWKQSMMIKSSKKHEHHHQGKIVISKTRSSPLIRWRKRIIGHVFRLVRWER